MFTPLRLVAAGCLLSSLIAADAAAQDAAATFVRDEHSICADIDRSDCYQSHVLFESGAALRSVAAAPDGRLFFIEGGRNVRVAVGSDVLVRPALTVGSSRRLLTDLVLVPSFDTTRTILVAEVETARNGFRELSIVRYREIENLLGERAVIVTGLPAPASGGAPFTVDDDGRIYVAIPSVGGRDLYEAMVLRFNADGTVPTDSRAMSPVFSLGLEQPS